MNIGKASTVSAIIGIIAAASAAQVSAKAVTNPAYYEVSRAEPYWEVTYAGKMRTVHLVFFNLKGYWPDQPNNQLYKAVKTTTGWLVGSATFVVAPIAPKTKNHYVFCKVFGTAKVRYVIQAANAVVRNVEVPVTNGYAISPPFLVDPDNPPSVQISSADINTANSAPPPTPQMQQAEWGFDSCIVNTGL